MRTIKRKFAVCADLHFNHWNDFNEYYEDGNSERLAQDTKAFWDFATDAYSQGCRDLVVAGDIFDKRAKVLPSVMNDVGFKLLCLAEEHPDYNIYLLVGNHDLENDVSKKRTSATTFLSYLAPNIYSLHEPTPVNDFLFVPWMSNSDVYKCLNGSFKQKQRVAFIHAPINGISGMPGGIGLDPVKLSKLGYAHIFAGHYHMRQEVVPGVQSIGALTQHGPGDAGKEVGGIIVTQYDDGSIEKEFWDSNAPRFVNIKTNSDEVISFEVSSKPDPLGYGEKLSGNYVTIRSTDYANPEYLKSMADRFVKFNGVKKVKVINGPKFSTMYRGTKELDSDISLDKMVAEYAEKKYDKDVAEVSVKTLNEAK